MKCFSRFLFFASFFMSYSLEASQVLLHEKEKALHFISSLKEQILNSKSAGDQAGKDEIFLYEPKGFEASQDLFITGGMGPEAGLDAFGQAIKKFPKRRIILDQRCSVPDRTGALSLGLESSASKEVMAHLAKSFVLAGELLRPGKKSLHLFISCNTAHAFLNGALSLLSKQQRAKLKVHSLIDVTAKAAAKLGKKILVLSTTGTKKLGLYYKALEAYKIPSEYLSDPKQEALMGSIYEGVKKSDQVKALRYGKEVFSGLKEGSVVIAGCTEIPLILKLMKEKGEELPKNLVVINPVEELLKSLVS